jgi:hypothetical protein
MLNWWCKTWPVGFKRLKNEDTKNGYHKFILGVDKGNQIVPYYPRGRKPLKLTKEFILFLPQTPALNSIQLKKTQTQIKRTMISHLIAFRKWQIQYGGKMSVIMGTLKHITDGNHYLVRVFKIIFWNVGVYMFPNERDQKHLVKDTKGQ